MLDYKFFCCWNFQTIKGHNLIKIISLNNLLPITVMMKTWLTSRFKTIIHSHKSLIGPFLKNLLPLSICLKSDISLAPIYWYVVEWGPRHNSKWEQVVERYGGRNPSTRRKPPTCRISLTNFITCHIEYTSP
jgi:hypothetical protein